MKPMQEMDRVEIRAYLQEGGIDVDRVREEDIDTICDELALTASRQRTNNISQIEREAEDRGYRRELIARFLNAGDGQKRPCYCPQCGSDLIAEVKVYQYHQVSTVNRSASGIPWSSSYTRRQVRPPAIADAPEYWECSQHGCDFARDDDKLLFDLCRLAPPTDGWVLLRESVHVELIRTVEPGGVLALRAKAHTLAPAGDDWIEVVVGKDPDFAVDVTENSDEETRQRLLEAVWSFVWLNMDKGIYTSSDEDGTLRLDLGRERFEELVKELERADGESEVPA